MLQKNVNILATSLNVLHNYFDDQTKLFSDLYHVSDNILSDIWILKSASFKFETILHIIFLILKE